LPASRNQEELPKLKLGRLRLWKEVKAKNRHSGRKMSDAIFIAKKDSGRLANECRAAERGFVAPIARTCGDQRGRAG
jgi:hypothetical protein